MGPGRTAEDNNLNVRVQTKVRGRLDVSSIKYPPWMSTWKKTVFCLRENRRSITGPSSVMSNPKTMPKHDNDAKTMPKHDNDTKPGDHTPDVDHGVVNVATQETKSETVTESSEQSIHDLHVKTVP